MGPAVGCIALFTFGLRFLGDQVFSARVILLQRTEKALHTNGGIVKVGNGLKKLLNGKIVKIVLELSEGYRRFIKILGRFGKIKRPCDRGCTSACRP